MKDNMSSDTKRFLMEPKHDNISVHSFLGLGMENMGISSKMDEFSPGLVDFSFLPDVYGGLDPWSKQDGEAGLKPEILDGILDEVEEVEHIYASHHPSSTANHFLPETQATKEASELDGEPYGFMNFSSESYPPGGSIGLSEWSNETAAPQAESSGNVIDKPGDNRKPLSTLLGSWVGRGRRRNKNLLNTRCSSSRFQCCRSDSDGGTKSSVSYDFRPRREPFENYTHHTTEITLLSDDSITSSESEDDISVSTIKSKSRGDRRKHQRMWTIDEVVKLLDGISHFGLGKWTDIKNFFFHSSSYRTPVDIRDKWRNLLKASDSNNHNGDEEAEEKRRWSAGRTIPKDILHRVRELASLHSKSLCDFHGSSRSQSTSRKKKKKKKS
ncbi:TRF-like 8 [Hirschfeldia incana]|nr:TRF-like 8 [Hirschfeldia incana]